MSEPTNLQARLDQSEAENARSRNQYNGIIDTQMAVIDELKAEVERLTKAVEVIKHQINYWTIESDSNHARWLLVLGDYDQIRAQVKQLTKAGDNLALLQCAESDEQWKRQCVLAWLKAKEGKQP